MTKRKPVGSMTKATAKANKWKSAGRLSKDVQARIGEQLRKMHDDIVDQGVPDRFRSLLDQLGKTEPDDKGSSGGA